MPTKHVIHYFVDAGFTDMQRDKQKILKHFIVTYERSTT